MVIREPLLGRDFVGRERELATMTARLDAAAAGSGGIILLSGEPGIGKTRTAEELTAIAEAREIRPLWGRCYEGEGAPAFWPWTQVLRSYLREQDVDALRIPLGVGTPVLAQLVPELREGAGHPPSTQAADAQQELFHLLDSVTLFLRDAARSDPLLIVLDDLHWADAPSLLLVQFLARELATSRILVVGTYRDGEVDRGHILSPTLAELARAPDAGRIALRGLAEHETAQILEGALGAPASAALVSAVQRQTEGNLFFTTEIARLIAAEHVPGQWLGRGALPHLAVPATVRDVIGRRLSRLSDPCNRLIEVAAVIGREFPVAVLARILARLPETPPAEPAGERWDRLLATLEEAERAGIITDAPDSPGSYRFAHLLFQDQLYEGQLSTRRARLRRLVGEALEALFADDLTPHLTALAYHFSMAVAAGDAGRAVLYARRAGDHAMSLYAYAEATGHYQRALRLLDLSQGEGIAPAAAIDGEAAPRTSTPLEQRCDLLLNLGEAQRLGGEMDAARQTFLDAGDLARRMGSAERLAHSALGIAPTLFRLDEVDTVLVERLEEALDALDEEDSAVRSMIETELAIALYYSDAHERSLMLGHEALAMAERLGDERAVGRALMFHQLASARVPPNERTATCDRMQRLSQVARSPALLFQAMAWRVGCLWELGDGPGAAAAIESLSRMADELRRPERQAQVLILRSAEAIQAGRFAEAEELAQRVLELGPRTDLRDLSQVYVGQIFLLRLLQGRLDELVESIEGLVQRNPGTPVWRCALAYVYAELGRDAEARAELEHVTARDLRDLPADTLWLFSVTAAAAASALAGDEERAALLYDRLLPYADRCVMVGGRTGSIGAAANTLGLVAASLRRWDDARRHFEDALAINARLDARPWLARTQLDYARMLLAGGDAGDRERALDLTREALGTAQELGMARSVTQAEELLDRPATTAPPSYPDGLTPREVEVLGLIASGRTTREIAHHLVVSDATVERHITNLYGKIGARNRADAAAYALRQGLT